MNEIWKTITDFDKYEVSNLGNVRRQTKKGYHLLKPHVNAGGYYFVRLSKDGKAKNYTIHRLVANAFIPNPDDEPIINHIDENKLNNKVDNLEWCSAQYNVRYSIAKPIFGYNGFQILEYDAIVDAEKDGFNITNIWQAIKNGGCHKGYRWAYKYKDGEINPLLETLKYRYYNFQ